MKAPFLGCGLYGVALAALIYTSSFTYAVLDLFIRAPYQLGTHEQDWMNWHGMGCLFVGIVNLLARRWAEARPRREVALATALIYGVWSLQNLQLMFTDRFTPVMWLHVAGCAVAACFSLAFGVSPAAAQPHPAVWRVSGGSALTPGSFSEDGSKPRAW